MKQFLYWLASILSILGVIFIVYNGFKQPNNGELMTKAHVSGLHEVIEIDGYENFPNSIAGKYFIVTTSSAKHVNEKMLLFS